ncbi:hypothetical protein GGR52DRAFT_397252 [Hypoxylon sp. FL1284]|nr:hypothetical protein GGR52DRAFT_397252 [Hypoxylon sp. FL1284]
MFQGRSDVSFYFPVTPPDAYEGNAAHVSKRHEGQRICGVGGKADEGPPVDIILELSKSMNSTGDIYSVGQGPRVCERVACSHNAAVWLCNDVSWAGLGIGAKSITPWIDEIANNCQEERHHGHITARGQIFDTGRL